MTEIKNSRKRRLSSELFERSGVAKVYRKRSSLFRYRLRLFCSLHKPVTLKSRLYHFIITALILFSCVIVNVFDEFFGAYAVQTMAVTDTLLTCILTAEMILRFWSSECITDFRGCKGKWSYLKRYGPMRALDLLGIITFTIFIYLQRINGTFGIIIRILHVIQVLQIYRLILPLLKLMINTILVQIGQLYIAFSFATILFVLMSFSVYLKEMNKFSVFDSFWFTYITLTTIGYGDLVPDSYWAKVLIITLGYCGICAFQLPANIFGTGLAIKLKDEQNKLLFQYPAANLMQSFWRWYATNKDSKQTIIWKSFKRVRTIDEMDKECIRFILKFRYMRARHQFKTVTDPKKVSDDSQLQLELLRKVSLIENILGDLKDKTHELRAEYESICNQLQELLKSLENE